VLGAAAAGLRLLEEGRGARSAHERAWLRAQLDPVPQLAAARVLVESGVRVGGDISDGLYREVQRLIEPAGLGATIDVGRLPLAAGLTREEWALAVRDSEDFELICAAPASRIASAQSTLKRRKLVLTVVGQIDRMPGIRLRDAGRPVALEQAGYEHFR
jgi:thiamine-monophosphate kinase